jgi:fructose-specific phosphotransferase system component IIB
MMRKEFCEKDGIRITYLETNVCFEDINTAESILIANDGKILFNNFDEKTTNYFMKYFHKIYHAVELMRELDSMEVA